MKNAEGDPETLSSFSQQISDGHFNIVYIDLCRLTILLSHFMFIRTNNNSGKILLHYKGAENPVIIDLCEDNLGIGKSAFVIHIFWPLRI